MGSAAFFTICAPSTVLNCMFVYNSYNSAENGKDGWDSCKSEISTSLFLLYMFVVSFVMLWGPHWDGGHEQLISNGGRFKPAFAKRDKKQTMIDLKGISTNWFKIQLPYVSP